MNQVINSPPSQIKYKSNNKFCADSPHSSHPTRYILQKGSASQIDNKNKIIVHILLCSDSVTSSVTRGQTVG